MKKYILLAALLFCVSLAGCGNPAKKNTNLTVVTTIFPLYDWTASIIGEAGEGQKSPDLKVLLTNGTDIHSYQPSAADIVTISTSDVFIYVGGESDGWVADVLKNAVNKDMIVVNLLEVLGDAVKEEETPEGATDTEKEEPEGAENGEKEFDEHIWLSLKNAEKCCEAIAVALKTADSANASRYEENLSSYLAKVGALDKEYRRVAEEAPVKTLLFGDRFPFRYLTDDYGISYFAAFSGCSAETEASFETVSFLAGKVNELGLKSIMIIDSSDGRVAETIRRSTKTGDQSILTLDSLQSVSDKDIRSGITYLSVMEKNLEVLKEALR